MSRSGYIDDCCIEDYLAYGRWRGQVSNSIRSKRGQEFLKELAAEMDAMSVKELIANELIDERGNCCAIGVICKKRGLDVSGVDVTDRDKVGALVGIGAPMAAEIEYVNDEDIEDDPAERWRVVRRWVDMHIEKARQ